MTVRAAALALACLAALGCSDEFAEGPIGGWIVRSAAGREANFRESRRIIASFEPADRALYRSLLPPPLEMPARPLAQVHMIDQIDVGPWPLTPYQEGSLNLRAAYAGEEGWYITALPVSTWVAWFAGRSMGYPKYVADRVRFEPEGDGWLCEVHHAGVLRIAAAFAPGVWPREPRWKREGWDLGGPVLNVKADGQVIRVGSSSEGAPSTEVAPGLVTIRFGAGEPWAGLAPPGPVPGELLHIREARSLEPEAAGGGPG